ncbi:MAG: hypothetical protein ORN85_07265 [Sediminibacterium sp.]|nr:hypothetical protein [Sediminibacterium sp.]
MKNLFFRVLFLATIFLSSCGGDFKPLEIKLVEGLQFDVTKILNNKIPVSIYVYNPNNKNIDVEGLDLKIFFNSVEVGTVKDPTIYSFQKETNNLLTLDIQLLPAALTQIPNLILAPTKKIELEGFVKASSLGFTKKIKIYKEITL